MSKLMRRMHVQFIMYNDGRLTMETGYMLHVEKQGVIALEALHNCRGLDVLR
jgi:hypothetical protein